MIQNTWNLALSRSSMVGNHDLCGGSNCILILKIAELIYFDEELYFLWKKKRGLMEKLDSSWLSVSPS